jgi:ankyrin repeat protein
MENATPEGELVHEVWRQDLSAIKRLLAAGANPNLPGRAWPSAIACAGENDETGDIARLLVDAGADINIQDESGQTPLHFAVDIAIDGAIQANCETFDWSVVEVFLSLGADPAIQDKRGFTVFDKASRYGVLARQSFDEFIRKRNSDGQTTQCGR